jgi:phosphotriesterase-related protein
MTTPTPRIETVLGPIEPGALGIAMMHEHLLIDFLAVPWEAPGARWEEPLTLANAYAARRNPFQFKAAVQLLDEHDAAEALAAYRASGGDCIVEVTPIGVGRDPAALRRLAQASGVRIVMGTGWYVRDFHPPELAALAQEALTERLVAEIRDGAGDSGVRPGLIGEIGLSWPVHPDERKVLRAAARAQAETGLALMVHPGRDAAAPLDAVRIVEQAGGDPRRTIVCHVDRTLFALDAMVELARTGCWLEWDLFGLEASHYPLSEIDMPNDARRVEHVIALGEAGHAEQVLISQDIDSKVRLARYGGEGYHHILDHVRPLMRRKGMTQDDVDRLLIDNPRRCLEVVA